MLQSHGSYPAMFERLLGPASKELTFRTYAAIDGEVPSDPHECDAWLVTGSRHGVYERTPWMLRTEELLRKAMNARVPVVGICFGHQMLAQALGGKVIKSDKGWGFGLHDYAVEDAPGLARKAPARVTLPALHQDQVVEVP
ncbi:MAG TPA: type 1 glutamine amidotransferase, partial [Thermoanaerobaculia bacterium]|nr:type 1 glutamine amidotransferase [Thermoanaerobaculia bacterium]